MSTTPRHRLLAATAAGLTLLGGLAACSGETDSGASGGGSGGETDGAKIAFLMPDQASTRYEEHDRPGFVDKVAELCPSCEVLYNNADGDASKQQQQFNSALAQGAKAVVIDPVDSTAAASLVQQARSQGVPVIAYDRPIPDAAPDFYVSFDNEAIGALIAQSLVDHLSELGVPTTSGGLLQVNGSPTDAAAGLIRDGVDSVLDASDYPTLAEFDTPEWQPSEAQNWVSGQISRFPGQIIGVVAANDGTGGGAIAAFKAAGVTPVPPTTGNDATLAGLQLVLSGDQYNTISKPSEVVAAAAAEVALQLIAGETPESDTTLFDAPSQLFTPTVITAENLKAEMVDTGLVDVAELCAGSYAGACTRLDIS
jgi:D-xylose transport system substrate-binding protein